LESFISLALDCRTPSPAPSISLAHGSAAPSQGPRHTILRLKTNINPSLFSDEFGYLYTGKDCGKGFEFLFDPDVRERPPGGLIAWSASVDGLSGDNPEFLRIDKLRKDLNTTAIFSLHRFILVSRSPYFHSALVPRPNAKPSTNGSEPPALMLPSPLIHAGVAALHAQLHIHRHAHISHRSFSLSTAFAILRSSLYLSLLALHDKVRARIIQKMMHGLFHAFIPFAAYGA
ncbi:hypothetical protein CVT25_010086, partial [Psilocybe cyanescens]